MSPVKIASLLPMLILLAVVLVIPVLIGVYVYRDAGRRGMNAVLWTLVAAVAPALVGFIIYLLVRTNYSDLECSQCGAPVAEQFVVCSQCGAKLRPACPSCSAPVEQDWKVCPYCTAPLDGAHEGVAQPRRRQDKGLGKILVVIIVVLVILIVLTVLSFSAFRTSTGSMGLYEVTLDEYDEFQESEAVRDAVHDWLDEVSRPGQRGDRAYILQYEYTSGLKVEKDYFLLIYVPVAGYQDGMTFGLGSGLFNSTVELDLERTGNEESLFCVQVSSTRSPMPKITLDGKSLGCSVRRVDYNPTLFWIEPNYAQAEPGAVELPDRLSVVKFLDHENVGEVVVSDRDAILKVLSAIDSGERVPMEEHPRFEFRDGFEILVEYQINGNMARHMVFMENGVCYLDDSRVRETSGGSSFRAMDEDFYGLLEGLFDHLDD